jgi:8-oxo-dGTP diphosphatase
VANIQLIMISVTCAVIRNEENEVLIVQRGEFTDHPMKWEFPGGKLIKGETEEECVIREVSEELSIDIVICGKLADVVHDYGNKKIRLIPFVCDTLYELPFLSEHVDFKWLHIGELIAVDFSEADVFVAKSYLEYVKFKNISEIPYNSETEADTKTDVDLQAMVNNMMSMQEAEWVATSAIENPAIFRKLIEYSFSADKKLAFRASWTLTKVCDQYPEMIVPGLTTIIESLDKLDNEGVQRCFLRIISLGDVNKINIKHHGILADHCFNALRSGFSAIAIKAYSMEILYRLALIYPELANELSVSINLLQGEESGAIQARSRMVLKKLAEIPIKPKSSQK